MWAEDVLVTRKKACRPEAISRYLAPFYAMPNCSPIL